MAEAASNGDGPGGAAAADSNPDLAQQERELSDADNAPKAVESDPTRRYTRVGVPAAAQPGPPCRVQPTPCLVAGSLLGLSAGPPGPE